jgi:hypothetical protein
LARRLRFTESLRFRAAVVRFTLARTETFRFDLFFRWAVMAVLRS